MPCLAPITVPKKGYVDLRVQVACGQCVGCRVDRTEDWTTRIMHEVACHDLNQFVTLTYDDEHLPSNGSLVKKDFPKFMKRLRRFREREHVIRYPDPDKRPVLAKVRYFAVGEYGDQLGRPHYHAVLFGIDFADKHPHSKNEHGDQLYTSEVLDALWGKGHCFYGKVTVQSARYVAKYCIKKVNGQLASEHYGSRTPEFAVMSLKPGIGQEWFNRFSGDVYPSDFVVLAGKKRAPPRFYDSQLPSEELEAVKARRLEAIKRYRADQTPARLKARMECLQARISLRKGKL